MATTAVVYNHWKRNGVSPAALAALTVKVTLHTSAYTPNIDTDENFDDVTNEVASGSGYTTGGETLASPASGIDTGGDFAYIGYDDTTWTSLTKTFRYLVARVDTGTPSTSRLIGYLNFGTDRVITGVDFVVDWAAVGSGGFWKHQ